MPPHGFWPFAPALPSDGLGDCTKWGVLDLNYDLDLDNLLQPTQQGSRTGVHVGDQYVPRLLCKGNYAEISIGMGVYGRCKI